MFRVALPSSKRLRVAGQRFGAVRRRVGRVFIVALAVRTVRELSADDATHMAAGVAYYALFSLFPLLIGLSALLSYFIDPDELQVKLVDFAADYLPGSQALIADNVDSVIRLRGALSTFAVIGLLWSGSAIFGAVTRAVNRAWDVHRDRPFYISKPRQLAMALAVGVLFLLSIGSATIVRIAEPVTDSGFMNLDLIDNFMGSALLYGTSWFFTLLIFLMIYKFMPNTKTYWRYIWPGAVVAAVLFEVAKNLFISYVNSFANLENVYGSLAPVVALLLWTYVSSYILFLGAELASEYGRLRLGLERGVLIHPAAEAASAPGDP